jgi:hypothetical protein
VPIRCAHANAHGTLYCIRSHLRPTRHATYSPGNPGESQARRSGRQRDVAVSAPGRACGLQGPARVHEAPQAPLSPLFTWCFRGPCRTQTTNRGWFAPQQGPQVTPPLPQVPKMQGSGPVDLQSREEPRVQQRYHMDGSTPRWP